MTTRIGVAQGDESVPVRAPSPNAPAIPALPSRAASTCGEPEEDLRAARHDQLAHVDLARRDGAGKRRGDPRERLDLLETPRVRAQGLHLCRPHRDVRLLLGRLLLAHAGRLDKLGVAGGRQLRQGERRLDLGKLVTGAQELLVGLRSFDLRQQLTLLDMRPEIHAPALDVAAGTGVDR